MASSKFSFFIGAVLFVFLFSGCQDDSGVTVSTRKRFKDVDEADTGQSQGFSESSFEEEKKDESTQYSELRNPFLSTAEEKAIKDQTDMILLESRSVSAILYAPPRSTAIIDGRIVRAGDMIDDKKIIEIQAEQVVLEDTRSKYYIKIDELEPGS